MWILILIWSAYAHGSGMTNIPNFKTETECMQAGNKVNKSSWDALYFTCVYQSK